MRFARQAIYNVKLLFTPEAFGHTVKVRTERLSRLERKDNLLPLKSHESFQ